MAIDFDGGTDSEINIGNDPSLRLTGEATYMCWLYLKSSPQNVDIISKQTSSNRGISLQTDDDPPDDTYGIFHIATSSSTTKNSGWTASPLAVNTWQHFAGVYIPSTSIQVLVDGVVSNENTTSIPATMYNSPNDIVIAGRPDSGTSADAIIADVRIYSRALPPDEIAIAAMGRDPVLDGLVSRLLFDGPPGAVPSGADSVKDMMVAGNHGTPSGTSVYAKSFVASRR